MRPETKLKLQNILFILCIGMGFGLLYNYLFYPHSLVEFLEAACVSIAIGLVVGILEEFALKKAFSSISFLNVLLIRSLLYSLLTSVVLALVLSIETAMTGGISYASAVKQYLQGPLFKRDFGFSLMFIMLMLFFLQVSLLMGRGNFLRLIMGSYHRPREVSRIFMFVDLKGSTTIAEQLGNKSYSSFIRDYFNDLSNAISLYKGEVYQYVGDEIIVVWPTQHAYRNCTRCFFKMEEIIRGRKKYYQSAYGFVPEFKAGMHAGRVIVTAVGKQKMEIVYHGDVLNTAARIEKKCNELNQKLLVSQDVIWFTRNEEDFLVEEKGEIGLKGKTNTLRLYGISLRNGPVK